MSAPIDLSSIPGQSGEEENRASSRDGGFAWSRQRAAAFGSVSRTTFRGGDAVLLTGEEGLRAFYKARNVVRASAKAPWEVEFVSDGVTPVVPNLEGKAHARRKAALLQAVSKEALSRYLPVIDAVLQRYVARWEEVPQLDLKVELQRLAFEVLSTVITGAPGDAAAAGDSRAAALAAFGVEPEAQRAARDRLLGWYRRALAEQRRLGPRAAPPCMMGILAHETDLKDVEIVAETQHLFVGAAGFWMVGLSTLVLLAGHPSALQRTRDVVRKLGVPPSLAELEGATYLQLVAEEVLRWAPIVNTQIGRAKRSFTVGGHRIPKGTLLVAGFYATNHSPQLYPEPDAFDPERAERRAGASAGSGAGCPFSKTSPFGYVPFGGGERTGHRCLGERLVYLLLKLLLSHTARGHTWSLVHPEQVLRVPAPFMASEVAVRFTRSA